MAPINEISALFRRQIQPLHAEASEEPESDPASPASPVDADPDKYRQIAIYAIIAVGVLALFGIALYLWRRRSQNQRYQSGFPCVLCNKLLEDRDYKEKTIESDPRFPVEIATLRGPSLLRGWGRGKYRCSRWNCWKQYGRDDEWPGRDGAED